MKLKSLLFAAFMFCGFVMFAQDWYNPAYSYGQQYAGYIIDADGNKTEGFIKYKNRYAMQQGVEFFTEKGNRKSRVKYKAQDLKEYKVGDHLYHVIHYSGGLLKKPLRGNLVVKTGCISEYIWYDRDENFATMRKNVGESQEDFDNRLYPSKTVYLKKGSDEPHSTDYYALGFAKRVSALVSDNQELSEKVANKEKGYRMLKFYAIIEEYNENCK